MDDPDRPDGAEDPDPPPCSEAGCGIDASFRLFDREAGRWRPVCGRHARHFHPSIEVRAWLESGYMKPVELPRPEGSPGEPTEPRARAFRDLVDRAMGWEGPDDDDRSIDEER